MQSQDIRKWFMKQQDKGTGNGNSSKQTKSSTPEKPSALTPQSGKLVQGMQECSGRRKTSKYFAKDGKNAKDEMEVEESSTEKKGQRGSMELTKVKSPPGKKIHKLENDDEDEDFVIPTSGKGSVDTTPNKKLKSGSGKGVAQKLVNESDEDDGGKVQSKSKSAGRGRGRGAKGSSITPTTTKGMDVDESDPEDMDDNDANSIKSGGRGRGGRGAPAGGRGRGGGGRGGFMNFGERKDPPHKGEKEVPEGAPDCLDGLTFVISGTLDSLEREEAEDLIKRHGGRVTGSVSKKTNYLLCDEDIGGRKSAKAKELGTAFLTEDGLFDMIRTSNKSKTSAQISKMPVDKVAPSPPKKSPQKSGKTEHAANLVARIDVKGLTSRASSSKRKDQSTAQTWLPWTEKYRPKVPNDIVGNQSLVKQLHDWLVNWNEQFLNTGKKGKGKKQNDSGAKKAVLLSGTPGIGKTTSAKLVSQMLGFQTIEVNASDSRGKADAKIEKGIGGSTSNSIKELVSNEALNLKMDCSQPPKTVLIMDEVDGMSAGDRGGVADLIASIKISKIPIICICNDRYSQKLKSLVNYCLLLSFRKPTKQQMAKRLSQIAKAEGLQVNEIALEELAERVNGDIRMALNQLQYMSLSMSVIKFDDIKQRLQSNSKDEDISPFTAVDKLFGFNGGKLRMDERIDLSMSDPDLVPLLIQENYINYRPSSAGKDDNGMKRMNLLARAAESIGDGDIINVQIRRYRQWQLSQIGCLASSIIPAAILHGQRETLEQGERNFNRFGGWLGKNSTMGKNYRLLEDLHVHLLASRESNLGRAPLRLDYLTLLLKRLTDPLRVLPKDEAVERVVEFMDLYSISMEDFDTMVEMSKFKGHPNALDGIQPVVKSALTRAYNKGSSSRVIRSADLITLPGIKKAPKKRVAAMLEPVEETLAEENAENEEEISSDTEDQEEELIDSDKKLQADLESLNSKGIQVQMELKGSGSSSSAKKPPSGRGKGSAATSDGKGGRGSRAASKRKR
ncbi:replication factor C subunit 1 [Sesamum indicum]|uniref:Replication factor C subunit 1 n=1 Tax=Sesamum indicum TaxID=4182 RepID=A0A6I9TYG8_SESIN|nr:replication factor C subunit 1 [Sesamum indicum]XP_011088995.1 replication factor C subunit 1 [Sesamum indicum]XP_020552469.1 replication factor C subunit 1 [Sesamum indicum]XP_020552470.1 replication factor C subunit 1 [Sesamum indicum]